MPQPAASALPSPARARCTASGMNYAAHAARGWQRAAEGDHRLPQALEHRGRAGRRRLAPAAAPTPSTGRRSSPSSSARAPGSSPRRRRRTRRHRGLHRRPTTCPSAPGSSQRSGGQWSKGKGAPGFCPLGPWLVTADSVDVDDLRIYSSCVNGEPRQDSNTSDMIFDVGPDRRRPQPAHRARAGRRDPDGHPRGGRAVRPLPLPEGRRRRRDRHRAARHASASACVAAVSSEDAQR